MEKEHRMRQEGPQGRRGRRRRAAVRRVAAAVLISLAAAGTAFAGEPGWVKEEDGWHYHLADGSLATGWISVDKAHYFLTDTGLCLTDAMTPDGYYVDGNGAWYRREAQIQGCTMTAPERFAPVDAGWDKSTSLETLQHTIKQVFGGARLLRITDTAIEYVSVSGAEAQSGQGPGTGGTGSSRTSSSSGTKTGSSTGTKTGNGTGAKTGGSTARETVLAGIYREPKAGQYRLDLRMKLEQGRTDGGAAVYDEEVFRAMIYQISSSPEILESAICSAWQGENQWDINRLGWVPAGDCQVTYTAGSGFGRFYIKARGAE